MPRDTNFAGIDLVEAEQLPELGRPFCNRPVRLATRHSASHTGKFWGSLAVGLMLSATSAAQGPDQAVETAGAAADGPI